MDQQNVNVTINQKYADQLFATLFTDAKYRSDVLALYNYLTGQAHADPTEIEIVTMQDVIYFGRKNDMSFLMGKESLNLWEEQSTVNPNMPLRGLIYFGKQFDGYVHTHHVNVFSSKRQKIPTPKYIIFEFGSENSPDKRILKLSDMFASNVPGDIEVTCTVYNIRKGKNTAMMSACKLLNDYTELISQIKIRKNKYDKSSILTAVDEAIDYCINNNILTDFLIKHKAEARDMLFTMADKEFEEQCIREEHERELIEATDKARAEGAEEIVNNLSKYLQKQHPEWTIEQCMDKAKAMTQ